MAFPRATAPTPVSIGDIEISMYSPDPTGAGESAASFVVWIRYSDDSIQQISGDLVPHLTQQQINALLAFMDTLRIQAQDQILP